MKLPYIESDCAIEHNGQKFESGGAIVTPDYIVAYPAKDGVLKDWHGKQIGTYRIISSRPAVFFGERFYFMRAQVSGREYSLRGFGDGMIAKGKALSRVAV